MKLYRIISLILIVSLLVHVFPHQVFAQEETPSVDTSIDLDPNTPSPDLNLDSTQQSSALLREKVHVRQLRKTYRSDEQVTVMIDNAKVDALKTEIFSSDGEKVHTKVEVVSDSNPVAFRISPPLNFKPGRYHLVVTDGTGMKVTQDFTWGVLAINTNKAVYAEGETAKMSIAVLNEAGEMVCDAHVILTVTDPTGVKTTMDSNLSQIRVNPVCFKKTLPWSLITRLAIRPLGRVPMICS